MMIRMWVSFNLTRVKEGDTHYFPMQYYHHQSVPRTVNRALALINVADRVSVREEYQVELSKIITFVQIYRPENIRIVAVHMETWSSGDRFPFSPDPDQTLRLFKSFSRSVQQDFDAIMLIT